jgi:SAM-dependent methyltransferase
VSSSSGPWQSATTAARYDDYFGDLPDTDGPVELLSRLAGDGTALELGVGTGRVAIPLAQRGVRVHGVDSSAGMLAQLRAKPGADAVTTSIGDFSRLDLPGRFDVVYAATGTFFELPTQQAQLDCFIASAAKLTEHGRFVIDGLLPDAVAGEQPVRTRETADGTPMLHMRRFHSATQELISHYVVFSQGGPDVVRVRFRYAWPGELDLMARIAGLRLVERLGNWRGARFGPGSRQHVSIYGPADRSAEGMGRRGGAG